MARVNVSHLKIPAKLENSAPLREIKKMPVILPQLGFFQKALNA
jgi:hypothetical protein